MNLPANLLRTAMEETGADQTQTVTAGLERLAKSRTYKRALALKGSLDLQIDLEASREDRPHP
ncbi:MAG: hypothetical protein AAGB14_01860 [Verrucomicrobiota bacterium]